MVLKLSSQLKIWALKYLLNSKNKVDYSVNTEKFSIFNGLVDLRSTSRVNKGKSTDF